MAQQELSLGQGTWRVAPDARRRRARALVDEVSDRLDSAAASSAGDMVLEGEQRSDMGRSIFHLNWVGPGPGRRLTVLVDPLAAELLWELHYAGAVVLSRREDVEGFSEQALAGLVSDLGDNDAWLRGDFRVREDRT